jgi:hypothetical protein
MRAPKATRKQAQAEIVQYVRDLTKSVEVLKQAVAERDAKLRGLLTLLDHKDRQIEELGRYQKQAKWLTDWLTDIPDISFSDVDKYLDEKWGKERADVK